MSFATTITENPDTYLIISGFFYIFNIFVTLTEMMTFFLVVKIMLPITPSDKETRSKFQRFLFKGFANKNELRAAVLANNPDINTDQRSLVI